MSTATLFPGSGNNPAPAVLAHSGENLLALLRAVTEYADNLEHDLGIPATASDVPAMAAAWAALEAARSATVREG